MYCILCNFKFQIITGNVPKGCVSLALKIAEISKQKEKLPRKITRRKAKLQKIIETFLQLSEVRINLVQKPLVKSLLRDILEYSEKWTKIVEK